MQGGAGQGDVTRRGFFVAFEGPEGAGKSTQIARLVDRLEAAGIDAVQTREPGGTRAGDRIREVILDPDLDVAPMTEFLLYSASRAQLMREVIRPALDAGRTVISDRFAGASLAYQGFGRGVDLEFIRMLTTRVTGGVAPDLTLLLDLDVGVGLERVARRGARDRLERADAAFHERVRRGFAEIAAADPSWLVVDGALPPDDLAEHVWKAMRDRHPALGAAPALDAGRPPGANGPEGRP